jgi:serine-type D-Ala-D-Ala carboxypeptidase (penicillin-binding protein 5/6)
VSGETWQPGRSAPRIDVRRRRWPMVAARPARWPARHALVAALAVCAALLAPVAARAVSPPRLEVRTAGLIEASTGQRLYGIAGDERGPIASTTKIMTALITLQHVHRLDMVFTQNDWRAAPGDSQIGLLPGERMTVHDLLLALLLPSADDAAEDLAFNVGGGSVSRFVAMMNAEAARLGLTDTHYSTPIGFDDPGNYSSAFDLDKLAAYALAHSPLFARIVDLPHAILRTGPERYVVNRNDLLGRVAWIHGVKTGHTAAAGYAMVLSGTRDGMTLIGAALGTSSIYARDQNALALLDYGFAEFRLAKPVLAGQVVARPSVRNLPGVHAALISAAGFEWVVRRSDRIHVKVVVSRRLAGPMRRGVVVGQALVFVGAHVVGRLPLLLARKLQAPAPPGSGLIRGALLALFVAVVVSCGLWLRRTLRLRLTRRDRLEAG